MIDINHLSFGYNRTELFSGLDLSIPSGRIYGLLGKNGVGKTSLLKLMAGLRFARSGECRVLGVQCMQRPVSLLRDLFYLPEEFVLPDMGVKQYQRMYAPFYPSFDPQRFESYLQRFELDDGKGLHAFSFGQKKKFLLAFGLAAGTRLLLLDEPTNGLDIPSKSQFRQALASEISEDRLVIISTHQARDLERIIDAIIILQDGTILFHESLADVSKRLTLRFHSTPPDSDDVLYIENVPGGYSVVMAEQQDGDTEMDLEALFNTVVSNPNKIAELFNLEDMEETSK